MKNCLFLLISTLIVGIYAAVLCFGDDNKQPPRPRFEQILLEDDKSTDYYMKVIHDKETGQEIVCYIQSGNLRDRTVSCWLTGRKW
jgi:hypothetical protein